VLTPHGGIALIWFVGLTYLYFSNNIDHTLFFGVVISVVSFFDDLSPKVRLIVLHLVASTLLVGLTLLISFSLVLKIRLLQIYLLFYL